MGRGGEIRGNDQVAGHAISLGVVVRDDDDAVPEHTTRKPGRRPSPNPRTFSPPLSLPASSSYNAHLANGITEVLDGARRRMGINMMRD